MKINENFGLALGCGATSAAINYFLYANIVGALFGAFLVGFFISLLFNYAVDGWVAARKNPK